MSEESRTESTGNVFDNVRPTLNVPTETQAERDAEWEQYIQFEALRRDISPEQVRQEEELAQKAVDAVSLDRDKLVEIARKSRLDHPYLEGDDESSPF